MMDSPRLVAVGKTRAALMREDKKIIQRMKPMVLQRRMISMVKAASWTQGLVSCCSDVGLGVMRL